MAYMAPKNLYVNKDKSKLVEESDPDAAFLLAAAGTEVEPEVVEKYGLGGLEHKQVAAAPENKQVKAAPENKAAGGR